MSMRVAHIVSYGSFMGGAERVAYDLAQGLHARGHRNLLVPLQSTGPDAQRYCSGFDRVVETVPQGLGQLRDANPDVLLLHCTELPAWLEAAWSGRRVVALVHDVSITCPRRHRYFPLFAEVCDQVAPWACWRCALVPSRGGSGRLGFLPVRENARRQRMIRALASTVVPSRYLADLLLRHGWRPETLSVVNPARFGLNPVCPTVPEPGTVLFVGALNRGKGPDLLLGALARLNGWRRLDVVGDGAWRRPLEQLACALGIDARVRFHGWLSAEAVSACYQAAQVVAFPSRAPESFGLVGLEAMAHGRPVVACDLGGVREWLDPGRTGLLAPVGDVGALANALGEVLGQPERARALGEAGRWDWEHQHSANVFVDRIERLLDNGEGAA